MSEKGKIAGKAPAKVEVTEKSMFWCACGLSASQPFCDGSHKGTEFRPKKVEGKVGSEVYLCVCKQTNNPPFCDGSHTNC
ncbi:MAG: CDGSH iron-sulfur domain-containing protein [Leptospiraceae bacterium]|nr:CDGSH iron-sulfur domain-containing protein [Leptospiraceae bacterium]MCP5501648.1 CDGSH iron-sulfur domain-containing protein [Leptospiraceae bacterium]